MKLKVLRELILPLFFVFASCSSEKAMQKYKDVLPRSPLSKDPLPLVPVHRSRKNSRNSCR